MIEDILQKLRTNEALSSEEENYLLSAIKNLASGKVPSKDKDNFKSFSEFETALTSGMRDVYNSPAVREFANHILREKKADVFVKRYKPIFSAILSGADLATSISQISQANKAMRGLSRPVAPPVPGLDPALEAAISSISPERAAQTAILPAETQIREQRLADELRARAVSGGQGALYSTLGNIASTRAGRLGAELIPIGEQARAREQARLNALLGLRSNISQQNFANVANLYGTALNQYNLDVGAAGALGQAGRQNLRTTMSTLPENLLRAYSNFMPVVNPYYNNLPSGQSAPQAATNPVYDQRINDYNQAIQESLRRRVMNPALYDKDPNYPY